MKEYYTVPFYRLFPAFFLSTGFLFIIPSCEMDVDRDSRKSINNVITDFNIFYRNFYILREKESLRNKSKTNLYYADLQKDLSKVSRHYKNLQLSVAYAKYFPLFDSLITFSNRFFNIRKVLLYTGVDCLHKEQELKQYRNRMEEHKNSDLIEEELLQKYEIHLYETAIEIERLRTYYQNQDSALNSLIWQTTSFERRLNRLLAEEVRMDTLSISYYLYSGYPRRLLDRSKQLTFYSSGTKE